MNLLKNIEHFRLIGGVIVVIVTAIWAFFSYMELQKPATAEGEKYKICVSDDAAKCPRNTVQLSCDAPINNWAKKECSSYSLQAQSKTLTGKCGVSIIEITCLNN